jgi:hypothetical protein
MIRWEDASATSTLEAERENERAKTYRDRRLLETQHGLSVTWQQCDAHARRPLNTTRSVLGEPTLAPD